MLNNNGAFSKHAVKLSSVTGTGVKGATEYGVHVETKLRVKPTAFGGSNVITVEGRLQSEDTWSSVGTVTGVSATTLDISLVDYIRYNITTSNGTGDIIASAFIFY